MKIALLGPAGLLLACFTPTGNCAGLTIELSFPPSSGPGNCVGGGNLNDVCQTAADFWMSVVQDEHTVQLTCQWGPLAGTNAEHYLTTQGGNPNRETEGLIVFDNDGSTVFFVDATPGVDAPEFDHLFNNKRNLGGGVIVVGRYHDVTSGPQANGHLDLLSVAVHEIGHALGFSASLTTYAATVGGDMDIDVTAPRPHPGTELKVSGDAHLQLVEFEEAVMTRIPYGRRRQISHADTLSVAELSQFQMLTLPP